MNLLEKIESFVSKECIEMGSAVHQLLQRFVAHAQEPAETPAPASEPTPEPIVELITEPTPEIVPEIVTPGEGL
jgi:hypothetical protein